MTFLKNIKKNVIVLGAVSLFTDISSEMLYPVVPIFLTSVLGAPMSVLGFIEGLAESTASILKAFSGWWSDKLGRRRPFVVAGYSLSAVAKPLLFLAYTWHAVLAARFLDRFGKGIRTSARDAMIADSTETSYRGKAFGFHRAMDGLGACIGPFLAIWLLSAFKDDLRLVFLVAFIPASFAVATLVFFLRETPLKAHASPPVGRAGNFKLGTNFTLFLIASAIFSIGNSSDAFLIMRAKDAGLSITMVVFTYVLYNISRSVLATPAGIISDRIPRKTVMVAGYAAFALVYAGFGVMKGPGMVWLFFVIYGFYIAMTDGVGKALVADMVDRRYVGTALGIYHLILGVFTFLASLIAGILWTRFGAPAPFVYGAATAAISALALAVSMR